MIKKLISTILISIFCSLNIAISGTIDPNVNDSVYIENAKEFPYVGKLCGKYADGSMFCASAVAISDRWIVTAAHVIQNTTEANITINSKEIFIEKFIYKKEFNTNSVGMNDIAVGYCRDNIGLKKYPSLYDKDDETSKLCDIVGYGMTGTFLTGAIKHDNQPRAGTNKIDGIFKQTLIVTPSKPKERTLTSREFLIASGDSGGGLFIDGKLAGINSMVMTTDKKPDSSYNDEGYHTRISIFKSWIENVVK